MNNNWLSNVSFFVFFFVFMLRFGGWTLDLSLFVPTVFQLCIRIEPASFFYISRVHSRSMFLMFFFCARKWSKSKFLYCANRTGAQTMRTTLTNKSPMEKKNNPHTSLPWAIIKIYCVPKQQQIINQSFVHTNRRFINFPKCEKGRYAYGEEWNVKFWNWYCDRLIALYAPCTTDRQFQTRAIPPLPLRSHSPSHALRWISNWFWCLGADCRRICSRVSVASA